MVDFTYHLDKLLTQAKFGKCLYAICNQIPLTVPNEYIFDALYILYKQLKGDPIPSNEIGYYEHKNEFLPEFETLIKPTHFAIIMSGFPGSGKTTLGRRLSEIFGGLYLDNDMFQKKDDDYYNAINQAIMEDQKLIILGKSHHTHDERNNIYQILPDNYFRLFIEFSSDKKIFMSRTKKRKDNLTYFNYMNHFQSISKDESLMGYKLSLNVSESIDKWLDEILNLDILFQYENQNFKYNFKKLEPIKDLRYNIGSGIYNILYHPFVQKCLQKHPIILQKKFYLTIKSFGKNAYPSAKSYYQKIIGEKKDIICLGIFYDEKGLCVLCKGDFPCSNKYAHITLGNSEGTKPFYSNELCENGFSNDELIEFETPIIVQGIILDTL